jgi:alpha-1,3-glucan synthase
MLHQFKTALKEALASDRDTRRMMRARSAKQRFPVAQWIADLDKLQSKAIEIHQREAPRRHGDRSASPRGRSRLHRPVVPETDSFTGGFDRPSPAHSRSTTPRGRDSSIRSTTPDPVRAPISSPGTPGRTLSLGRRAGPGHAPALGPSINIVASTPMSPRQRSDT